MLHGRNRISAVNMISLLFQGVKFTGWKCVTQEIVLISSQSGKEGVDTSLLGYMCMSINICLQLSTGWPEMNISEKIDSPCHSLLPEILATALV